MDKAMELLNWIFQDFWHFLGVFLLLGAVGNIFSGWFSKTVYHRKDEED